MTNEPLLFKDVLDHLDEGVYFLDTDRRITYWNHGAELISGFHRGEVEGCRCMDNILIHVDAEGRKLCQTACPALATISDGRTRTTEAYLHHKDGHRVPVLIKTISTRDIEGHVTGAVEVFTDRSSPLALESRLHQLEDLAMLDPLTGIPNRRYMETALKTKLDEMHRYGWGMGVIFADIDDFKRLNDEYGHHLGDEVLRIVTRNLLHNSRLSDIPCRWGGEEFVVISDNVKPVTHRAIAERYRMLVETSTISTTMAPIRITISVGATLAVVDDTPLSLVERADRLMYESKRAGKNRVTIG